MHSADLTLDDDCTSDSMNKMLSFLEAVRSGIVGRRKFDDVTDCEAAIKDIQKVI